MAQDYGSMVSQGFNSGFGLARFADDERRKRLLREGLAGAAVSSTPEASGEDAYTAAQQARAGALTKATSEEEIAQIDAQYQPTIDAVEAQRGRAAGTAYSMGSGANFQQYADKSAATDASTAARAGLHRQYGTEADAERVEDRAHGLKREAKQDARQAILDDRATKTYEVDEKLKGFQLNEAQIKSTVTTALDKLRVAAMGKGYAGFVGLIDTDPNDDKVVELQELKGGRAQLMINGKPTGQTFDSPTDLHNYMKKTIEDKPEDYAKFKADEDHRKWQREHGNAQVAVSRDEKTKAEVEKKAKADAAVTIFKENNPGASAAQIEAVRTGVMGALPEKNKRDDIKATNGLAQLQARYGGQLDGDMWFPDEKNKDVAIKASSAFERHIKAGKDPMAAAEAAINEAEGKTPPQSPKGWGIRPLK